MLFKGQLHIRKEKNIWWGSSFSCKQIKSEAQQIAGSGAQREVKTGDTNLWVITVQVTSRAVTTGDSLGREMQRGQNPRE